MVKDTHGKDPREEPLCCIYLIVPSCPHELAIWYCFPNFDTDVICYRPLPGIQSIVTKAYVILQSQEAVTLHEVQYNIILENFRLTFILSRLFWSLWPLNPLVFYPHSTQSHSSLSSCAMWLPTWSKSWVKGSSRKPFHFVNYACL